MYLKTVKETQYGIDFKDKDKKLVKELAVGFDEAQRDRLYDEIAADPNHPQWPETAEFINQWWQVVTTHSYDSMRTPYGLRNPATGRFMRTSYREDF